MKQEHASNSHWFGLKKEKAEPTIAARPAQQARPAAQKPDQRSPFELLREVFRSKDLSRLMPGLALSALFSNLLAIVLPLAILQIMDRVVVNQSIETLALIVMGVIVVLIVEEALRYLNGVVTAWLGARFEHHTTLTALNRMIRVPMKRYQKEEPGVYAERIEDSTKVAEFYSGRALLMFFDLPFAAIFLILIYIIGGLRVVLVPIVLLTIFLLVILRFGNWMKEQVEKRHVMDDRRFSFLAEVLGNIHSVKAMTMEGMMLRRYERLQEANAEMGETLTRGNALAASLGVLFSQIMILAVIFVGATVVIGGGMTTGGLAACMMLSVRALSPLRNVLRFWLRFQTFSAAQHRLNDVLSMPCSVEEGKPAMPPLASALELNNVTLNQEGGRPLFQNLSVTVPAKSCIAIRGDSGSGKSSLLGLLCGLVDPDSGEALVDGRRLQDYAASSIHRQIAFLPQSSAIVSGTILENLTMFDDSLNARALSLARDMGLDNVVAGMKLGYETPLGEGGAAGMPEGVRQMITIVRALVTSPSVILFDEANIALDIEGDQMLRDYLVAQKGKSTMVLVTHRPSLLSLADKVYSLSDGRLTEADTAAGGMGQMAADQQQAAATPPRPEAMADLNELVARQFSEESDLSVCLVPMLSALGWQGNARDMAEALPHLVPRLDVSNFCAVMANLQWMPKHFPLGLSSLDSRLMPCLFVPIGKPAIVVLERLSSGRLRVFDSATRSEREIAADNRKGEVFVFHKAELASQGPRLDRSWFGKLAWRLRKHIALGFVLTIIGTFLSLAPPLFVKAIYERVLPSGDLVMGAYILAGAAIAITMDWHVRYLRSRVMAYLGGRTEYTLGNSVFERVVGLPASSTERASVSRQVGRIKNLEGLREFFLGPMALLAFDLPASLILLAVVAMLNVWIVVVILLAAVAYVLLALVTRKFSESALTRGSHYTALRWEFVNEMLTNLRAIRAVGAERRWIDRFRELSGKSVVSSFDNYQAQARIASVAQVLGGVTGLCAMATSAYLVIQGSLTGGALLATMMLVWRLTGPMQNVFMATTSLIQIRGQMRQIENLMKLQGERDAGTRQTIRPATRGALGFARVSFRYANDADPALLGINFTVKPGELVVLTGPNGAGKSTLLKQVVRAYTPQAGTVSFDGIDIRQLTAPDLRARISYMPQQCEIFYGTVAQNLRLANPAATQEELRWAASMAGILKDIEAMREGFETRISNSRSGQLPHGFRQRLSLARTMLKPAAVVLLDEPGTGLDQAGEDALMHCIEFLRGNSTVLMVSHRPGHMRMANQVVYMERGAVAAMGTYDQIKDRIMSGMRK